MRITQLGRAASAIPLLIPGFLAAMVACLDPFVVAWLDVPLLRIFPFQLTVMLCAAASGLAVIAWNFSALWRHREVICLGLMFLGAQLIGLKVGPVDPLEVTTVFAAGLWLVTVLFDRDRTIVISPLFVPMLGILSLAVLFSVNQWFSLFLIATIALSLKWITFFMITQSIRTREMIGKAMSLFMGVAVFSAVAAILQELAWLLFGIPLSLLEEGAGEIFKPIPFVGMMVRATAFNPHPQHLSGFLLMALPMFLFKLTSPGVRPLKWVGLAMGVVLCSTGIVLTLSANAMLVMALLYVLFLFMRWPGYSIHFVTAGTAAFLAVWFSGLLAWVADVIVSSVFSETIQDRIMLIKMAAEKFHRSIFVGEGLRNFDNFTMNFRHWPVHNAYLQAATELSVFGGLLFLGIIAFFLFRLFWIAADDRPADQRTIVKIFLLAFLVLLANAVGEPTFDHSNTWVFFGFLEAVILTLLRFRLANKAPRLLGTPIQCRAI